jgi:hypothetical protein
VLLEDAQMPRPDELPETLRPLETIQGPRLRTEAFEWQVEQLIGWIERALGIGAGPASALALPGPAQGAAKVSEEPAGDLAFGAEPQAAPVQLDAEAAAVLEQPGLEPSLQPVLEAAEQAATLLAAGVKAGS